MKPETNMRQYLIKGFRKIGCDAIPVENGDTSVGTPDINVCLNGKEFWIECKVLNAFPKRVSTKLKIRHFTKQQLIWIKNRVRAGGRCFLILKMLDERAYWIFDDIETITALQKGELTGGELVSCSTMWFGRMFDFEKFTEEI